MLENHQKPTGNIHQSYSSVAASLPSKPKSCDVSVQTEMTWPETFSSPVLTSDCIISNVNKSVQSATNMDYESANSKRSRGDSPPSHEEDELPNIVKPPNKRDKKETKRANISVASHSKGSASSSLSGNSASERVGGEGRRTVPGRPPDPPPRPTSRSGSRDRTKSGSRRSRSPIKHPPTK